MNKAANENDNSNRNSNKINNNELTVISLATQKLLPTQAEFFNTNAYGEAKFSTSRKAKVR